MDKDDDRLIFEDELASSRYVDCTDEGVLFCRDQMLDSDPREVPLSHDEVAHFIAWYTNLRQEA